MRNVLPIDVSTAHLLRERGEMTISALAKELDITATAVRQRLNRLTDEGFVQRTSERQGRGRPSHRYSLTDAGRREAGENFADLAFALWDEVRSIADPEIRRGLLQRIAGRMAKSYGVQGKSPQAKMEALAALFGERQVPFTVKTKGELPILTAECCPYPTLAEKDRGICAMEKMMFSEMVGEKLHLSECRLDGGTCCTFELSQS